MRRALVTGVTGQDGSYLAELLIGKGYDVYGMVRKLSFPNHQRIAHLKDQMTLLYADLVDEASLLRAVEVSEPDEVYNLAAQSFVPESWTQPMLTSEVTGVGATRLLEAVRRAAPRARFYQAGTSEMFGQAAAPQSEGTKFYPRSPYGVAKAYAYSMTVNYRESYGMFACNGILFNHESPRRGFEFVTRKITHGVARIVHGLDHELRLGNLDARRDWGYAPDYVDAMWRMLQQEAPEDYVIATGVSHSVRDWAKSAFEAVGLDWQDFVVVDERFLRPAEVSHLEGNARKAKEMLGWEPTLSMEQTVKLMIDHDMQVLKSPSIAPTW